MDKNNILIFIVILVGGALYIAFVEKEFSHIMEYMSAISLAFIACALLHIAAKMKK